MKYSYTHFIPENVAPKGATRIVIKNGTEVVCSIPLTRFMGLTSPQGNPVYSFGLVSDIHLGRVNIQAYGYSWDKFDNALSFFKKSDCSFCIVCGDLTVTGLYYSPDDTPENAILEETQFSKYREICNKYDLPVYELMGNHESYYGQPIEKNKDLLKSYTGNSELSYVMEKENDLFILCGQNHGSSVMREDDYSWLCNTLDANKDKRCFVFVHPYIEEDSGDSLDVRENSIFDLWGTSKKTAFMNLMKQYQNTVLFHGHSHMKLECQEFDVNANYTERNGFKSVHIPSLATPRDVEFTYTKDGETTTTLYPDTTGSLGTLTKVASRDDRSSSQAYIVDVYPEYIVLNGLSFSGGNAEPVPLGTYKIDT